MSHRIVRRHIECHSTMHKHSHVGLAELEVVLESQPYIPISIFANKIYVLVYLIMNIPNIDTVHTTSSLYLLFVIVTVHYIVSGQCDAVLTPSV